MHWLLEHFLVFFALAVLACVAYPQPTRVATVLRPFAVRIEPAQALTPDRNPDSATALVSAASVASAVLLVDGFLPWWRHRQGT